MATKRAQVKCINKTNRTSPHERIQNIGGYTDKPWKISVDQAIRDIESREWEFYTLVNGKEAKLIVATNEGRKYVKTEGDGLQPNNLLSLPECP